MRGRVTGESFGLLKSKEMRAWSMKLFMHYQLNELGPSPKILKALLPHVLSQYSWEEGSSILVILTEQQS